ncbi:B-cell antigen receptor complex-associated protein alpha chain isoform X2 [Salmo salar]|uniref:B-cell antigen receptor complex-associated protein alpha chain isoform X2 n=1 Tax=Salmo salar TaxID=8030 RepID=A0A1S3QR78_SALSA|nr:B-cell antigen receptor complex-associated protein alpha chain-like isoform X2 [Salmo salar]|eukprot:XP_014041899.1 PREDICTED: B-cell antigen receptor complex-associated protein alpha chain-like isoform X2 [Salmo salar]
MVAVTFLFLCFWAGDLSRIQVTLEPDRTSVRVQLSHTASLRCCYSVTGGVVDTTWATSPHTVNGTAQVRGVDRRDNRVTMDGGNLTAAGVMCHTLILREARLNDSGLYQCFLNHSALWPPLYTHGTFLHVYRPMVKILDISESTKNGILTAEGMLLMMAVLLHGTMMLFKTKKLNQLKKKRVKEEEENIYEGLNLEECCSTYDQIQRSLVQGPYQDVGNMIMEEEEEIQLEKP